SSCLLRTPVDMRALFALLCLLHLTLGSPPKDTLFEDAQRLGYVVEQSGHVIENSLSCSTVVLDFDSWLNATRYVEQVIRLVNNTPIGVEVAAEVMKMVGKPYMVEVKRRFAVLTAHLDEYYVAPIAEPAEPRRLFAKANLTGMERKREDEIDETIALVGTFYTASELDEFSRSHI
ncbi:hypothetical protein PFISCL1PPCAC_7782, partial [Pristionchus fissidentatus]